MSKKNYNKKKNGNFKKDRSDNLEMDPKTKFEKKPNAIKWYNIDDNLKKSVAGLSYNLRTGDSVSLSLLGTVSGDARFYRDYVLPGILVADMAVTYGSSNDESSPMTQAAISIYQYVRSKLKTIGNYNASEIMKYLIQVDSAEYLITDMVRALQTSRTFSVENKYLPRDMLNALGYDFDDIMTNITQYTEELNFIIKELQSLYCPRLFFFQDRHNWLFSNIFVDDKTSEKCQFYVDRPMNYWQIDFTSSPWSLKSRPWNVTPGEGTNFTFRERLDKVRELVHILQNTSIYNRLASDMYNAYGLEANHMAQTIDVTNLSILPVWSDDHNLQIMNSITTGKNFVGAIEEVIEENSTFGTVSYLKSTYITEIPHLQTHGVPGHTDYYVESNSPYGKYTSILNMPDSWSGDDDSVIEATRLMPGYSETVDIFDDRIAVRWEQVTTELVLSYTIVRKSGAASTRMMPNITTLFWFDESSAINNDNMRSVISALETFDFHPTIYQSNISGDNINFWEVFQNLRKYTTIDTDKRVNLNRFCTLGEFRFNNLIGGSINK